MATTTQPTTPFYQPVKSSEIENKIVNAEEAEAMEADDKLLLFHFLRNVSHYGGRRCGVVREK